jgi:integrase
MATITTVKTKKGIKYRGQIRIRRKGKVVYSECYTASKRALVEAWARKRESDLEQPGALDRVRHKGLSVGDVLKWYQDFSANSGRSKREQLIHLQTMPLADRDAIRLTVQDVMDFATERARDVSPSTLGQDMIWLRLALRSYHLATGAPVALQAIEDASLLLRQSRVVTKSRRRTRRPTVYEMTKLMDCFTSRDLRSDIPMAKIVLFAMFSGRRQDEICRIRWDDLDARRRAVLVRQMKHPRAKEDTWVFLPDPAWAIIQSMPRTDDRIFPYQSKSVGAAFTRACRLLEIPDLHFHDARRECTSWLFELGWDIPKVSGVTGHKSWSSLQIYTSLRESGVFDKWDGWCYFP